MEIRRGKPTRELRQIGNLTEGAKRSNPQRRRVYDINGIAPCMYDYSGGGNLVPLLLLEYGQPIKF